jgi:hypothetical protein
MRARFTRSRQDSTRTRPRRGCPSRVQEIQRAAASDGCTTSPTQAAAANNRSAMRPRVLIFSRRRREIAAIEGRAV